MCTVLNLWLNLASLLVFCIVCKSLKAKLLSALHCKVDCLLTLKTELKCWLIYLAMHFTASPGNDNNWYSREFAYQGVDMKREDP